MRAQRGPESLDLHVVCVCVVRGTSGTCKKKEHSVIPGSIHMYACTYPCTCIPSVQYQIEVI